MSRTRVPKHSHPCFLQLNDERIVDELKLRGYREVENTNLESKQSCIFCMGDTIKRCDLDEGKRIFEIARQLNNWKETDLIDCQGLYQLFLMIAAIRRDSDQYQIFTDGTQWKLCNDKKCEWGEQWHKATPAELVVQYIGELKK